MVPPRKSFETQWLSIPSSCLSSFVYNPQFTFFFAPADDYSASHFTSQPVATHSSKLILSSFSHEMRLTRLLHPHFEFWESESLASVG